MVSPAVEREARPDLGLPWDERAASVRYQSQRGDNSDVREKLCGLEQQRCQLGYRRLHILQRREGVTINRKNAQRLYREEQLTVWLTLDGRLAIGARAPALALRTSAGVSTSCMIRSLQAGGS